MSSHATRRLSVAALASSLLVACGGGGGGGGGPSNNPALIPDTNLSEFRVTPSFGTPADGTTPVEIEVRLISLLGTPIPSADVDLEVEGFDNRWQPLPPTDATGLTRTTLASGAAEKKRIAASTTSGGTTTDLGARTAEFLRIPERTYFVRASGSDLNDGRTPLAAWATLTHALASVEPGATVHVGAGTYAGPLATSLDSSATTPLVLAGDRAGAWTGDSGDVRVEGGGAPAALRLAGARNVVVSDLSLTGAQVGLRVENASDVRVLGCRAFENDLGVRISGVDRLVLQDCRISDNGVGLSVGGARATRIENDLVYANVVEGALLAALNEELSLRFNTFFRNGGDHVRESEPGGGGAIEENIFAQGGGDALVLLPGSGYSAADNMVWDNAAQSTPPVGSVIESDPQFVDADGADQVLGGAGSADDDFRVRTSSQANDGGKGLARDVVLGSQESLATRTTRADDLPEWSGADAPATNLGFHTPLAELDFRSLAGGGARLAHALPGDVRPVLRAWDRASPGRAFPESGPAADAEVVHLEHRVTPLDRPEELLALQVDTGTRARVLVRHWDGRRWCEPALAPFLDGVPAAEAGDRRFDVEYESLSGDALLVVADGAGRPVFRTLVGGGWSVQAAVPGAAPAGRVLWVELVPRAGSDELALLTLDDQRELRVALWNGSSFGAWHTLDTAALVQPGWRSFDAAWESLSGDLLVSWGFNVFNEETRFASLGRASGQWVAGRHTAAETIGASVRLSADPSSDRIVSLTTDGEVGAGVVVALWDGAEFRHTAELSLATPAPRLGELAWIGQSGVACALFRRPGGATFQAALLLGSGWRIQPDVVLPGVGPAAKASLRSVPGSGELLGQVLDESGALFAVRYDGQRFSLVDEDEPLATGLDASGPGRPFDSAARRAP